MKVIIAGSRTITKYDAVSNAIQWSGFEITEVVSGGAIGVDTIAERWAADKGIEVKRFDANWDLLGKAAGPVRNAEMAQYADALIAVWDGKSRGTMSMINLARKEGLQVHVQLIGS